MKTDIYAKVTDKIVAALETGAAPWHRPWAATGADLFVRPRRQTGQYYQGINVLMLWSEAADKGYRAEMWMTYKQAQGLGAHVRKGEHGSTVVYADRFVKTEQDKHGNDVDKTIPFLKQYTVFNVEQIDDLPAEYYPAPRVAPDAITLHETSEAFFLKTGATIRHGGDRAYYNATADRIQLPEPGAFESPAAYASTKAHEVIHWTSAPARLDRVLGKRFGDDAYAAEELIAEIGAAFLCADLGVSAEPRADHASYLAHWLQILKADKRAIFTAATAAQKAADYCHARQTTAATVAA